MISDNLLNPCECVGFEFDPTNVSVTQKEWLTKQVVSGVMTAAQIAKKYKLKRVRVVNWVFRHRKGRVTRSSQGRALALDREALLGLQEWLARRGQAAENTAEVEKHLKEAYQATRKRRRSDENVNGDDSKSKMSRVTMLKYLNYVKLNKVDELLDMVL